MHLEQEQAVTQIPRSEAPVFKPDLNTIHDELGHGQPAGEAEVEHRAIANAVPAGRLGRIQDRVPAIA
jgi:hypothetical protein